MPNVRLIDLTLFDEGAAAPATGAEGAGETGAESKAEGAADQPTEVLYGKQEVDEQDPQSSETDTEPKAEPEQTPEQQFEAMIKGDYKEQFDNRVQSIINARFKNTKALESQVGELTPIMDILKEKYGVKDTKDLMAKLEDDVVEEKAFENDMQPETYREVMRLRRENAELAKAQQTQDAERQMNERVAGWNRQAEEVKTIYPEFDLQTAAQNEQFVSLLQAGVTVQAAYEVSNLKSIMQQKQQETAKATEEKVVANVKNRQKRPNENATKKTPGAVIKSSVKDLTAADRAEIARRAARGEKISF